MITFDRARGVLLDDAGNVKFTGIWSGHGPAMNDPSREREIGIGPLPGGIYIVGEVRDSTTLGPFVMNLDPAPGTEMYGRALMRVHGDTVADENHVASDGCIVAPRPAREWINAQHDRRIRVI
jgi:hypothetical protein